MAALHRMKQVRMTNPTVLSVAYQWCFALAKEREKARNWGH